MKKEHKYLKLCNNPAEKDAKKTMKKAFFFNRICNFCSNSRSNYYFGNKWLNQRPSQCEGLL